MLRKTLIIAVLFVLMMVTGNLIAGGDAANGKALSGDCASCHGEDGMGDEDIPRIAGLDAAKIAKELADFKSGARVDEGEMMVDFVADLSEQDMADLAAYFSSLPGK